LSISIPIPITVKNGQVMLEEDSIQLHQHQVREIKRQALTKTKVEWLKSSKGIKINLTSDQQKKLVDAKDQVLQYLSSTKNPKEILSQEIGFGFAIHAFERILERVERLSPKDFEALGTRSYSAAIHPETSEKIVSSLVNSQIVHSEAEWKGYSHLNFKFMCTYDGRDLEIVINFSTGILIVTLIITKETGYFVREIYSFEENNPIKKPSSYL